MRIQIRANLWSFDDLVVWLRGFQVNPDSSLVSQPLTPATASLSPTTPGTSPRPKSNDLTYNCGDSPKNLTGARLEINTRFRKALEP